MRETWEKAAFYLADADSLKPALTMTDAALPKRHHQCAFLPVLQVWAAVKDCVRHVLGLGKQRFVLREGELGLSMLAECSLNFPLLSHVKGQLPTSSQVRLIYDGLCS